MNLGIEFEGRRAETVLGKRRHSELVRLIPEEDARILKGIAKGVTIRTLTAREYYGDDHPLREGFVPVLMSGTTGPEGFDPLFTAVEQIKLEQQSQTQQPSRETPQPEKTEKRRSGVVFSGILQRVGIL